MTSREMQKAVQQADDAIMALCAPKHMTPAEAIDFLGQISNRCEAAIEALHDENPDIER